MLRAKKNKPIMGFLKSIRSKDVFWKSLKDQCEKSLGSFSTVLAQSPDEDYEVFKSKLAEAITSSLEYSRPLQSVLSARLKSNWQIAQLKSRKSVLFRAMKVEKDIEKRKILKQEAK